MNIRSLRLPTYFLLGCAGAITGCQSAAPAPDVPETIHAATGVADPISFQPVPELDDVHPTESELTLVEASRRALRHAPELQSALARVRIAQAEAQQTRLLPNPVLNVALRFPEGGGKPVIEAGLAADLVAILQQPRRTSAADFRLRAAAAESLSVALDLLKDVQVTYAEVQALDAELTVLTGRKSLIARLLSQARARVEIGESPQLDVLTLDSERLSLDVEIAAKESDRRQKRLELMRMIGTPSARLDLPITPFSFTENELDDEGAWIIAALKNRPEVQAGRWELLALGDDSAMAQWAMFEGAEIGVEAERDGEWSIGPAVSTPLPLFDWGQARRAQAEAKLVESRHKLVQTRRTVIQEVRQALESLRSAQQSVNVVRNQLLPVQQKRIQQAEAAYHNGLADITAVLIAEQESHESRAKLIELQLKSVTARYRLFRAVGGPSIAATLSTTRPTTNPSTRDTK